MQQWSVIDLASITDTLIGLLRQAITNSPLWTLQVHGQTIKPFNIEVSGAMPAVDRNKADCVLSLYLLHVSRDPYWRNSPPQGALARTNPAQPLSLNLSYLLTAYADANFWHEQQAMSIALNCFHENPIYKGNSEEFTITVEADTIEEMSRLWQAITVPIRLSSLFRVAVVFLQPSATAPVAAPPPIQATISVGTDLSAPPQIFQVATRVTYLIPAGSTDPAQIGTALSQPVIVGGDTVRLGGSGLDGGGAAAVYLSIPDSSPVPEWPITAWRVAPIAPAPVSAEELVLLFPNAYAALPASGTALTGTPPPGRYALAVGGTTAADRSSVVPITVAPRIDGVTSPPQLTPNASGIYTINGMGFTAGQTVVALGATALTSGATAAPGQFTINATGSSITFQLPTAPALPTGKYFVRILVKGVEAPPSWWVAVP